MRRLRFGFILTIAGLVLAACAGQKVPPPSTDIDETAYRTHLRILAGDDFEGRRPGTVGEDKTIAYLTEQFKKLGLKPGNGESYVQQVPLVEITAGADATLSVSGPKGSHGFAVGKDAVFWTKQALAEVRLQHSALVFVGYGIVAPEFDWNDYADIDVKGKTVVVLIGDPGTATKDPKLFKGNVLTYYGRWSYKIEEAARQGAACVLLIHDAAAGYGWNVIQNTWSGPQLESAEADGHAQSPAVEGWIQGDAARTLFAAAGLDYPAQVAKAAQVGFRALALPLSADATLHNSVRQLNSANVIAVLPGGSRKKEYVLYTAHWDHLGKDALGGAHATFDGAEDNATGVAGLLTIAQSFSRTKPVADRSIVFLALTGGESGLLGSAYYLQHPVLPLREAAAVINLDMLHIGGPTRDVSIYGFGNTDLEETARAVALLQGREAVPDPNPDRGFYFWSDNFNFARRGIPVLYVKGGIDDAARGPAFGQAQLDDYIAHRYRQSSDQYRADWDVRGALDDLFLYYDVGTREARSRRFARWYPNSDYRVRRGPPREPSP